MELIKLKTIKMPHKLIESDAPLIATLSLAFITNLIESIGELELSTWLTIGTFILAAIISLLRGKVYYVECKIKKLQYKHMLEDDEETDDTTEE